MSKTGRGVPVRHRRYFRARDTDNADMAQMSLTNDAVDTGMMPWAMQMRAVSWEEPDRLVQTLTGAILGCGGWVLSRGASDTGAVNLLFEFERRICIDIYSVLVAAGVDLTRNGHIRFTELCQCTAHAPKECGKEIASVDLEIQTVQAERLMAQACIHE